MAWEDENNHGIGNKQDKPDWEIKFEEYWNKYRQKLHKFFTQNGHHFSQGKFSLYLIASFIVAWLCSGIYIVDQGNRGIVTRFGAYQASTMPGPHWHIPFPVEQVSILNIEKQRFIEVGYRSTAGRNKSGSVLPESRMLTEDENIINLRLAVQYQIKNAKDYVFNVKDNTSTLKQVTESVTRGVIGQNSMDFILTEGRTQIVSDIKEQIQSISDMFGTGIKITSVNLQDAQPPEEVQSAFEDAIKAREDKQRLINEAQAYANEIIPKARGTASRMIQEAEAYEAEKTAKAKGESARFDQLLSEYEKSPGVTRKRLYLEAKENLYRKTNKVVVNVENGNSMFYMPLNQMANNSQGNPSSSATANQPKKNRADLSQKTRATSLRPSRSQK